MRKVLLGSDIVRAIITGQQTQIVRSKCPNAKKGDRLYVQESLWISECGRYYARPIYPYQTRGTRYDVLSIDGKHLWYGGDRTPQTTYPDYRFMVGCYGSRTNTRCKKRHAFELSFGEYDTGKVIKPLMGNTQIGKSIDAIFMKRIPATRCPKWAVRLWLDVVKVKGHILEVEIANSKPTKADSDQR